MNFSVFSLFLPENQDSLPEERERETNQRQNLLLEIEQEVDLCLSVSVHITCSTSPHTSTTYAVITHHQAFGGAKTLNNK